MMKIERGATVLDKAKSRPSQPIGKGVEFNCRTKHLSRPQDQRFNVFECDVLGQIPNPDPLRHRWDIDDACLPEGRTDC
ncbi:hypothetical protein [Mesorhizobium sp. B263B2A]|uniref:hypothetical protein n=1 Tax=Mesorhizobium sp. B263B2A TaxID=2876669 RepID=UPI001CD0DF78|nr:hypothetical protein [Mesorhizobium sp. B263B2A]MCA0033915.1 hypothetical protein [Mesorhizobium sp. B263B2A]